MKTFIFFSFFLISISTVAFGETLNCKSLQKIDGWDGVNRYDFVNVSAVINHKQVGKVTLAGTFKASSDTRPRAELSRDQRWTRIRGIGDAWCSYTLVVPANPTSQVFPGFLDRICEGDERSQAHKLTCRLN